MVISLFSISRFSSITYCIKFSLSSHVSAPSVFPVNPLNRRLFRLDVSSDSGIFSSSCWCFCSISLISSSIVSLALISSKSLFASSNDLFWNSGLVFKLSTSCLSYVFSLLSLSVLFSNLSMLLLKNFTDIFFVNSQYLPYLFRWEFPHFAELEKTWPSLMKFEIITSNLSKNRKKSMFSIGKNWILNICTYCRIFGIK